jgi:hypothetical protein
MLPVELEPEWEFVRESECELARSSRRHCNVGCCRGLHAGDEVRSNEQDLKCFQKNNHLSFCFVRTLFGLVLEGSSSRSVRSSGLCAEHPGPEVERQCSLAGSGFHSVGDVPINWSDRIVANVNIEDQVTAVLFDRKQKRFATVNAPQKLPPKAFGNRITISAAYLQLKRCAAAILQTFIPLPSKSSIHRAACHHKRRGTLFRLVLRKPAYFQRPDLDNRRCSLFRRIMKEQREFILSFN